MKNAVILGKKNVLFIFVCMSVSFASCQNKIIKIEQDKKNPIEYVFSCSKDSLHNVISKQLKYNNMMLWDSQHGIMVLEEVSNMFSQKGNSSDFCLMPIYFICKSKIYFTNDGDLLDYEAWFYLHLESIEKNLTKVKITTIEPKVIVGRELLPTPPHFGRKYKKIDVESSTIEEYEILLKIGDLVGEKDMPSINITEKK
jgi:hypothetical protein